MLCITGKPINKLEQVNLTIRARETAEYTTDLIYQELHWFI